MTDWTVTFTDDQALVLSDWLYRVIGTERFDTLLDEDPAVTMPVYALDSMLERQLPYIFAADYGDRLAAARLRLLEHVPPRPRPAVRPGPGPHREVSGWIHRDTVRFAFGYLASLVGYAFDQHDEAALVGALDGTDEGNEASWFEYPLEGSPALRVRMAADPGSETVTVGVQGEMDDVLAARVETTLDLLARGLADEVS
jgi:hypothetical protein